MWDEIWAEEKELGNVKGTLSKKDEEGVTRTISIPDGPAGNVKNEDAWLKVAKAGGKLAESGKMDNGTKAGVATEKEVSGKQCVKAVSKLFGLTKKKPKPVVVESDDESDADDTPIESAAAKK